MFESLKGRLVLFAMSKRIFHIGHVQILTGRFFARFLMETPDPFRGNGFLDR